MAARMWILGSSPRKTEREVASGARTATYPEMIGDGGPLKMRGPHPILDASSTPPVGARQNPPRPLLPVFVEKFRRLDAVSKGEFHTYAVGDLVLPKRAAAV
jgi:hypothetical protein